MIYKFRDESVVDELSFKTSMVVEKYELGLSVESWCVAKFLNNDTVYQDNEVTVVMSHEEAIKLRDALITMYPIEV